jgi:hypothetical protein
MLTPVNFELALLDFDELNGDSLPGGQRYFDR